jgi:hypothetical protein
MLQPAFFRENLGMLLQRFYKMLFFSLLASRLQLVSMLCNQYQFYLSLKDRRYHFVFNHVYVSLTIKYFGRNGIGPNFIGIKFFSLVSEYRDYNSSQNIIHFLF